MKRNGNVLLTISAVSFLIAVVLTLFGSEFEHIYGTESWEMTWMWLAAAAAAGAGVLAGLLWISVSIIIDRQELILVQLAELKRAAAKPGVPSPRA
jgi:hypothetical protein